MTYFKIIYNKTLHFHFCQIKCCTTELMYCAFLFDIKIVQFCPQFDFGAGPSKSFKVNIKPILQNIYKTTLGIVYNTFY